MSAVTSATRVFVYGTLRHGSTNPHAAFLSFRCRRIGSAKLPGRLFRHGAHFAAVHEPESKKEVVGDILLLPHPYAGEILQSLDRYEGIGAGLAGQPVFQRHKVMAVLEDGNRVECWTWLFLLPVQGLMEIRSGDALA